MWHISNNLRCAHITETDGDRDSEMTVF